VKDWDLTKIEVEPHQPRILSTTDDARAIVIDLPGGEELGEHEVHERALIVVAAGEVEIATRGGEPVTGGVGHLFEVDPSERHEVRARTDARLLLLLVPWPGVGHPGAMTLEQKAEARERAAAARDE
jgi:quercetin dioxygenase-like cupin family protein